MNENKHINISGLSSKRSSSRLDDLFDENKIKSAIKSTIMNNGGKIYKSSNGFLDSIIATAGVAIGAGLGTAVSSALNKAVDTATDTMTTKIATQNAEQKLALEEKQKTLNLPSKCPHCNAPTSQKIVCEYCGCKIIE